MENICRLRRIFSLVYRLERSIKKRFGITANEIMVLCLLNVTKLSAGELSREMGISESRMSKIIDSLEKNKYIVREVGLNDKRKMMFSITEKGIDKVREFAESDFEVPDIDIDKLSSLIC
ncbi:MAG: MarR family transcriptional regulator [Spirochaetia bacterium]|nr:MarR family transcriptional regulator [Spirochaetota bacterium]MCX8097322.1 MarR family transcriptional regulator [Spirochaetota bacterium]MDW8112829.1 MarR family transcriptional regulator [Spirochaetia bacterium]